MNLLEATDWITHSLPSFNDKLAGWLAGWQASKQKLLC